MRIGTSIRSRVTRYILSVGCALFFYGATSRAQNYAGALRGGAWDWFDCGEKCSGMRRANCIGNINCLATFQQCRGNPGACMFPLSTDGVPAPQQCTDLGCLNEWDQICAKV